MKTRCLAVLALLCAFGARSEVSMPAIFSSGMVLQHGQPVPVWGWATPGETVTVEFAGQKRSAQAAADGAWRVALEALKPSAEPQTLKVSGSSQVSVDDVVVGEVWLCSGQSNMEWPVQSSDNFAQEREAANLPLVRHFKVARSYKPVPQRDVTAKWEHTTPDTIGGQSAVAYFFGRRLHQELKVPVGLINSSWGGTRIEPWTPPCGFEGLPQLAAIKKRVDSADPTAALHKEVFGGYVAAMHEWIADAQARNQAAQPLVPPPAFPAQLVFPEGPGKHQEPTVLYNGMLAGLVPFAIKGAIWYQGESNNGEGMLYLEKTRALVNGWRKVWGQGDFPYYLVQLAPYNYGGNRRRHLAGIWEAQAAVASAIPNCGYTVINDIGNIKDIHPRNKQDVGLRMANQALNRTYGRKDVRWQGPTFKSYAIEGARMRITFDHADGLKTRDGKAPDWFELCGQDGLYRPAQASIEGSSVLLEARGVTQPLAMRFAWDQLAEPNLVNALGLPTGAFRCGDTPRLDGAALSLPELREFRKLYEIDLPVQAGFSAKPPAYAVDNRATIGNFTRVAYVLQLQNDDGIQYVMTAMDAFTQDAGALGIPYSGSKIHHQTKVANLTVRSNVESIPALDNSDGGNIEFWGFDYWPQNKLGLPGANGGKYDFDDQPSDSGAYGCMQVHSWKEKVTLWAYNNFNGGNACEIGIGNSAGDHPDYTFSANGNQYGARRLTVLVK